MIIISLAIALIFALFIGYGIEVFNPSLKQEDFCLEGLYEIYNEEECLDSKGVWNEGSEVVAAPVRGFCTPSKYCYNNYNQSRIKHDKIVFIAAVIFGLLGVIAGIILKKDTIGFGLLTGGVLTILYGTIRYWQHANNTLKFLLLGIVLAVLMWIGYKKIERK